MRKAYVNCICSWVKYTVLYRFTYQPCLYRFTYQPKLEQAWLELELELEQAWLEQGIGDLSILVYMLI